MKILKDFKNHKKKTTTFQLEQSCNQSTFRIDIVAHGPFPVPIPS